ncbi:hypothetical protein [Streptomyces sp. NPDC059466]|uniref:hypothetical protein n=1 Tax=unclassified Streptomyces TaxID=2593676 RepID=UPI0036BDE975
MIPTAAPPVAGAAPRPLRAAAGRRALHASLLVAGLFVLGLLCGEQAHAADGRASTDPTTPVASAVERAAQPVLAATTGAPAGQPVGQPVGQPAGDSTGRKRKPRPDQTPQSNRNPQPDRKPQRMQQPGQGQNPQRTRQPGPDQRPQSDGKPQRKPELVQQASESRDPRRRAAASAEAPRVPPAIGQPVSLVTATVGSVVRPVADTVVRPVGDLVETLTGEVAASLPETLPSLPAPPAVPQAPTVPSLPSTPSLPGVLTPPSAGDGNQIPSAEPDHPQRTGVPDADPVAPHDTGREPDSAAVLAYGPAGLGVDVQAGAAHRGHGRHGHRGAVAGPAPARQAPAGDSSGSGALGDRPAVDGGGSRHGDAHAVAPHHHAPPRLVSATSQAVTAAGTRDRYRDVPIFPG